MGSEDDGPRGTPQNSDDGRSPPVVEPTRPPEDAAARIVGPKTGAEFGIGELPRFKGDLTPPDLFYPPDEYATTLNIEGDHATLALNELQLRRRIDLTLHIEDVDGNTKTAEASLESPEGGAGLQPIDEPVAQFDLSGISLPTKRGGNAVATATDSHSGTDKEGVLVFHNFVGVPYDGAGGGTYWFNDASINSWKHQSGGPGTGSTKAPTESAYETIDSEGDRVFLTAQMFEGTLWGASTTLPKTETTSRMQRNRQARTGMYYDEVANAEDYDRLADFAQNIWDAQSAAGITDLIDRVVATAHISQRLEYKAGRFYRLPSSTLWDGTGNCTDKSLLLGAIISCEPFDVRTGFIRCKYIGTNHRVTGIDARDLPRTNEEWFTFAPDEDSQQNGVPDTEYVFLETTAERDLGEFDSDKYQLRTVIETSDRDTGAR